MLVRKRKDSVELLSSAKIRVWFDSLRLYLMINKGGISNNRQHSTSSTSEHQRKDGESDHGSTANCYYSAAIVLWL